MNKLPGLSTVQNIKGKTTVRKPKAAINTGVAVPSNYPFSLAWRQERWDVFAELDAVLPTVHRMEDRPGSNGVGDKGGPRLDDVKFSLAKRGWTFIEPEHVSDLEGYENGYLVEHQSSLTGGTVYATPFDVFQPGHRGATPDWSEYQRFIVHCVEQGIVGMPTRHQLEEKRSELESAASRPESKLSSTQKRLLDKKIAIIDRYLDADEESEATDVV